MSGELAHITNSSYGSLVTPTRSNTDDTEYKFIGWYTATTGGTEITASTKVTTAGNHTLYARWQKRTRSWIPSTQHARTVQIYYYENNLWTKSLLGTEAYVSHDYSFSDWQIYTSAKDGMYLYVPEMGSWSASQYGTATVPEWARYEIDNNAHWGDWSGWTTI